MAVRGWAKFVDGNRLINGTHLNNLFTAVTQMANINVAGTITASNLVSTGYQAESTAAALTAVGTNRATALAITRQQNFIGTAAASTGVVLPSAATAGIGATINIYNGGANAITVYGAGSDTIDGVAGATGVPLTNAKRCSYTVSAAATWISAQLGVVSA